MHEYGYGYSNMQLWSSSNLSLDVLLFRFVTLQSTSDRIITLDLDSWHGTALPRRHPKDLLVHFPVIDMITSLWFWY